MSGRGFCARGLCGRFRMPREEAGSGKTGADRGQHRTLMRNNTGPTATDVNRSTPAPPADDGGLISLRYIGGASVVVTGTATRKPYAFSPMRPAQTIDVRDLAPLLRTRLFVRSW